MKQKGPSRNKATKTSPVTWGILPWPRLGDFKVAAGAVLAHPEAIQELGWHSQGRSFDEMPVYQASTSDLDERKIDAFLQRKKFLKKVRPSDELFLSYRLMVEEHNRRYPSVAGILLFGKAPQRYLSECFIIATHYSGFQGRNALAAMDCTGTLFEQFELAYDFILSRLQRSFSISGKKREDKLEIPEVSIREALINALAHRNYHVPGPARVSVYDNRVEIFSPGIFPGPLTPGNLEMGITYIRNMVIAKIMREAGLMEKLGSGFITIFDSYRKRGLKTPQVVEGDNFVKCMLPREKQTGSGEEIAHRIQALFMNMDEISVSDMLGELKIPRATMGRHLRKMVDQKTLQRVGHGRGARYRLPRENRNIP